MSKGQVGTNVVGHSREAGIFVMRQTNCNGFRWISHTKAQTNSEYYAFALNIRYFAS